MTCFDTFYILEGREKNIEDRCLNKNSFNLYVVGEENRLLVFYLEYFDIADFLSQLQNSKQIIKRSQEGSVGLISEMQSGQMDKMCNMLLSDHITTFHNPDLYSRLCINLLQISTVISRL